MAVAGLFAGIGGFEHAFSQANFETNFLVEIDPAARAVLQARFPDVEIRSDVCDLSSLPPNTTVVTAGFPCQNLSMAGDKSGISGSKSGVVEKLFDLISDSDGLTIVIENVYFMLQLDSGRAMEWLVSRFEGLGYHWAYRVLDTLGFGLPSVVGGCTCSPHATLIRDAFSSLTASLSPTPFHQALSIHWVSIGQKDDRA